MKKLLLLSALVATVVTSEVQASGAAKRLLMNVGGGAACLAGCSIGQEALLREEIRKQEQSEWLENELIINRTSMDTHIDHVEQAIRDIIYNDVASLSTKQFSAGEAPAVAIATSINLVSAMNSKASEFDELLNKLRIEGRAIESVLDTLNEPRITF